MTDRLTDWRGRSRCGNLQTVTARLIPENRLSSAGPPWRFSVLDES